MVFTMFLFSENGHIILLCTEKKVEPKRLFSGAILENSATFDDGSMLSLNSATGGAVLYSFSFSVWNTTQNVLTWTSCSGVEVLECLS